MEIDEIELKINDLDKRLEWEEQIHKNHEADGNVYKWDYKRKDKIKLIGMGAAIGFVSVMAFALVFRTLTR